MFSVHMPKGNASLCPPTPPPHLLLPHQKTVSGPPGTAQVHLSSLSLMTGDVGTLLEGYMCQMC